MPLESDRVWEQYGHLLQEYRFQVDLNWKRTQYFLVLNLGVLTAGTGLLSASRPKTTLVASLFLAGVLLALLSILASHVQHGYYRRVRDTKAQAESELGLGGLAIKTTRGMSSDSRRWPPKVRHALTSFFGVLALANLLGFLVVVC